MINSRVLLTQRILLGASFMAMASLSQAAEPRVVAITQIVEHPALDAARDIPVVFAADTATVARGAAAAMGFDYYDHGRQAGVMVARILEGEKAGERMGITLSDDVIADAEEVVKSRK
ncbi:hypothetical protein LCGC14_0604810 [marine sediment metagenome]|uniref:Uncharacterized protein n=1 Tax=marine sediment metagenome TaxID=412755 RepID=A0A0F9TVL7_9ZZZZ|nr:ABC transporter substrate binding protein [Marinobacter antarcticus]